MKAKQWLYNFKSLNKEHQKEVAKVILESLEGYSDILCEEDLLNKLIESANAKSDVKKLQSAYKRYQTLTSERQERVKEVLFESIDKQCELQRYEENKKICEAEGHIYGDWKHHSWTTREECIVDHQHFMDDIEHHEWSKTCTRCGHKTTQSYEPEELVAIRREKAREEKIKRLEKELYDLKNQQSKN